jgi:hypothetical protein
MRRCVQCSKPLVDRKTGEPRYDTIFCESVECRNRDHKEKVAAKRRRLRLEIERRVNYRLAQICRSCDGLAFGTGGRGTPSAKASAAVSLSTGGKTAPSSNSRTDSARSQTAGR